MAEYKVLKDFTFRGAKRVAGEVIILGESKLEKLTEEGFRDNVELLDGSLPQTSMSDENTIPETPVETPVETPADAPVAPSEEAATPAETPSTEGGEAGAEAPVAGDEPAAE